jgi:4-hydroxy-tetrahydrodipicolinate synthase
MPLSADQLKGMWASLLVSWTPGGQLDEETTRENVRRICRAGIHGVYTHGTTGEFYAQSEDEWRRVARATIEESKAFRVPCQIGCTALWTGEVIRRAEFAQKLDAEAIQIAFPFWMELSDSQAVRFLQDIAHAVPDMPIILYNTERSKKLLTVKLLQRIIEAGVPLVGCKGVSSVEELRSFTTVAPQVKFFVGEPEMVPFWKAGVRGCYSSFVLACPAFMLRYYAYCEAESPEAGRTAAALERFMTEFVVPCVERGLYDSALDRCIASTTGFLKGPLLLSRAPYDSASAEDVKECREWFSRNLPEFLQEG